MPHFIPRKRLYHALPKWLDTTHSRFFITICCQPRGRNQLANKTISEAVVEALEFRVKRSLLYPHLVLLMPDHLHAILGSNETLTSLEKAVSSFKQTLAQRHRINWQKGFFDHRLRNDDAYEEKANYILQNPVRAKLCENADDWPHRWFASDFER